MNKKTMIGLGVSALAIAAIAGVVSARRAMETKADVPDTVYIEFGDGSAWKSWGAKATNTKVHMWGGASATTWPGAAVSNATVGGKSYFKVSVLPGSTNMLINVWGGESPQNKTVDLTIPTDGKNLFTVTTNYDDAEQTGAWSVLDDGSSTSSEDSSSATSDIPEVSSDDSGETLPDGIYLVGLDNDWTVDGAIASEEIASESSDLFVLTGITLNAGDAFKLVTITDGAINWADGYNWGYDALKGGDGKSAFKSSLEGNLVVKEGRGSSFNIYLNEDHEIYIFDQNADPEDPGTVIADGVYMVGVDGWSVDNAIASDAIDPESGNLFVKKGIALAEGEMFKLVTVTSEALDWDLAWGYEALVGGNGASCFTADANGNIVVKEGKGSIFDITLTGNGYIYIVDENAGEPVDPTIENGVYLVGLNGWTIDDVVASDPIEAESDNEFVKEGLELNEGDAFKLVVVLGGAFDWEYNWGYGALKGGNGAANFDADEDGNLVVKEGKGSVYDIYLNHSGEIYIVDENAVAPTIDDGIYLVGLNGWTISDVVASDPIDPESTNIFVKEGLSLKGGDAFKIVVVNSDTIVWESCWGIDSVVDMFAAANFIGDGDGNITLKEGKDSVYDIYLNADGEIYIVDENAGDDPIDPPVDPTDIPAEEGFYLCGNDVFTGDAETAWKYAGAKKMTVPTDPENTNLAEMLDVEVKAGEAIKARSYVGEIDTWYTAGTSGYSFAEVDEEGNYVFTKDGTYNFYLNSEGLLYVTGDPAGPIAEDGYIWLSTGDFGMGAEMYLYTWTDADVEHGTDAAENAEWPGMKVSEIPGAEVSNVLNFNESGGIWKVPATALYANFIVSVQVGELNYQTGDLISAKNVYVDVTLGEMAYTSEGIAKQAAVAFEIDALVASSEDASLCKADAEKVATVLEHYDALHSETDLVDAATIWTYAGKDISGEAEKANWTLDLVVAEMRNIVAPTTAYNVASVAKDNAPMIVTIAMIASGIVLTGAMIYLAKRRKSRAE